MYIYLCICIYVCLFMYIFNGMGLYLTEGKGCLQVFIENSSQSYGASPAIWDHTVLPATRQGQTQENALHLNPSHAGQYSIYLLWMQG